MVGRAISHASPGTGGDGQVPAASDAPRADLADRLFSSGGEMARLMRHKDWSQTPLGPIEAWPGSLRTAVSICLDSRFPILLWWGTDLVMLYNDAYRPMLGTKKHPSALGQPGKECWPEIWDIIGPMLEGVVQRGQATWSEDQLLPLERSGYVEECYFTFSYSPIRDESGGIGGVFTAVTETTGRVLGERRLRTLRELATRGAEARSAEEACSIAAGVLGSVAVNDVPFALLYLLAGERAVLAGASRLSPGISLRPAEVDLTSAESCPWPLADVAAGGVGKVVAGPFAETAGGAVPAACALVLPLAATGGDRPAGLLVAGVSARRALDVEYRGFFDLLAGQIAAQIADARAYEEERRRAEALAELDRAKTTFFNNISHEFRTPLTLALGPLTEVLANDPALSEGSRSLLEVSRRNGLRLLKLVNSLLDFSRIEAGRLQARFEPVDLAAYTADLASLFRSAVERAGLELNVDCPPLDEPIYVDRSMWENIVLNLISNALKFTLEGAIDVELRGRGDQVELIVRDTGVGIATPDLPHVFERFHRAESRSARTHEGAGIGLALVQELTRLHGGTVSVSSVVGQGSTFTVLIPRGSDHLPTGWVAAGPDAAASSPDLGESPYVEEALRWLPDEVVVRPSPPAASTQEDRATEPPARILVADDNADMRAYIGHLLGPRFEVELVANGEAALEAVRRQPPDLILADVMMPGLDGFQLLRMLRSAERSTVPVILLSARAGEEATIEGLGAGADAYLVKPFAAGELLAQVDARLTLFRMRREADAERERARAERDGFLSAIAHDLRSPITALLGQAQLLQMRAARDQLQTEQLMSGLAVVEERARTLTTLIDELLDVTQLRAGRPLQLNRRPGDLVRIVRRAVDACKPAAGERRVVLATPVGELRGFWDETRLARVIGNLLDNAIKYSPDTSDIDVTVAGSEGSGWATVAVQDRGIGVPEADRPHIFEWTYRARNVRDVSSGAGIGLAGARQIIAQHGGTIDVESVEGNGSRFTIRLPTGMPAAGERGRVIGR